MGPYPHAIFYDFVAYQDKSQRQQPTGDLVYENVHVPVSVSVGNTLDKTPTHICDSDPKRLVRQFMEELERRVHNALKEVVRAKLTRQLSRPDVEKIRKDVRSEVEEEFRKKIFVAGSN